VQTPDPVEMLGLDHRCKKSGDELHLALIEKACGFLGQADMFYSSRSPGGPVVRKYLTEGT